MEAFATTMESAATTILRDSGIDIDQPVRFALLNKSPEIHSITGDASVQRAISMMSERGIGCLVVLDRDQRLVGMISERDYCRKVILMGRNSQGTRVREIMVDSVPTVSAQQSLREVMELMTRERLRHVPVMENDAVIAVLSLGDVVKWVLGEQGETIRNLRHQIARHQVE